MPVNYFPFTEIEHSLYLDNKFKSGDSPKFRPAGAEFELNDDHRVCSFRIVKLRNIVSYTERYHHFTCNIQTLNHE